MDDLFLWLIVLFVLVVVLPIASFLKVSGLNSRFSEQIEHLKRQLNFLEREVSRLKGEIQKGTLGSAHEESAVPEIQTNLLMIETASPSCYVETLTESLAEVDTVEIASTEILVTPEEPIVETKSVGKKERETLSEETEYLEPAPSVGGRFFSWLLREGNIWVCAGILFVLISFGLGFRYAIQEDLVTLEMRLAIAAMAGLAMVVFGFRMRERRRSYALTLQGGGMGVLYLVVFGAAKFSSLSTGLPILPQVAAIVAMLLLSVFTVLLALLQDYQPLAIFAIAGGFAAPILVSTGSRNYVALFSIYTLLNLEILAIAFRRKWRLLNFIGFILTVGVGAAWGARDWEPSLFSTVEPFLLIFLATYSLVVIRVMRLPEFPEADAPRQRLDLPLTVALPFVFFFLQMQVVKHFEYGMAFTCLGLALWYLAFGAFLMRKREHYPGDTAHFFMTLSFLFSNLVVPYAFEGEVSSAIWAVEGAFLFFLACRYGSFKVLLGGLLAHIGALVLYMPTLERVHWAFDARLSPIFLSGLLFTVAHWLSGFWASRFRPAQKGPFYDTWEQWLQGLLGDARVGVNIVLSWFLTILGSGWWWWTVCDQVPRLGFAWLSIFPVVCLTALVGCFLSLRLDWKAARFLLLAPVIIGFLWSVRGLFFRIFLWSSYFVVSLFGADLIDLDRDLLLNAFFYFGTVAPSLYLLRRSTITLWTRCVCFTSFYTVVLFIQTIAFRSGAYLASSQLGSLFSEVSFFVILFFLRELTEGRWATDSHRQALTDYRWSFAAVFTIRLLSAVPFFFQSFTAKGSGVQGVFIPILNFIELWQAVVMLIFLLGSRLFFARASKGFRMLRVVFFSLCFIWVNQVVARGIWQYSGDIWSSMESVLRSSLYQATIAILWGVFGLLGVLRGQKTRNRLLWCVSAGLLGVDMLKLLLLDLSRATTLSRILAFLVAGMFFLLIGWLAPLPPKDADASYKNTGEIN